MSYTDILNLTIIEKDSDSDSDNSQISIHSDIVDSPIVFDDEIKDSKDKKGKNKRSKRPDTSISPRAKRSRLQPSSITSSKVFRKSESFDHAEFL
jgi:hypothetical protein